MQADLSKPVQGVHLLKEAVVCGGSLILMHVSSLNIDLYQLKDLATL